MNNICEFSPCRTWRYTLEHVWADGPLLQVIGLNPSTADETKLDPTLRRVRGFAQAWGYGGFVMTNLFAYRSTDPAAMMDHPDPIGPDNDFHLLATAHRCQATLAAWGVHGRHLDRDQEVFRLLAGHGLSMMCLGRTKHGAPRHPLYVRADTGPDLFTERSFY